MDEKRKGEIAYQLLKRHLREELSLRDISDLRRRIGNIAKEERLDYNEVAIFTRIIVEEAFQQQMDKAGMWAVSRY